MPRQIELSLGGALSAALNRTAREHAVTLNTVLQTAWGILLGRLTGRDDVVFGVTVAGRPAELAGVEQMVGLFINTLPLRMALLPQLQLSDLLRQTQERQSGLMAYQHIGLSEIQQAAGSGRTVRYAPGVRELSGRPRGPRGREQRTAARPGRGPRCDALSAGADRAAGRGAAVAARLSVRPVRRGQRSRAAWAAPDAAAEAAVGGSGSRAGRPCRSWMRRSATPSCGCWNDTAHPSAIVGASAGRALADAAADGALLADAAPATLPSCLPRRRRARRMRPR